MTDGACPCCGGAGRSEEFPEGTIFRCDRCSLEWAARRASPLVAAVEEEGIHSHYLNPVNVDGERYEPYVAFFAALERLAPAGPLRILDIGCGTGIFMAAALRRGHDVLGIELDERHRALLGPDLAGRVVFAPAEAALPQLAEQFDVVCFWDSFEHMDDPFALLEPVEAVLKPGGVIFARINNTHDIFNLVARAVLRLTPGVGRKLYKSCFNLPQHAWNFSARAMTSMLIARRWQVVSARVTETPSGRLTANPLFRLAIEAAYQVNRAMAGGKIGEYWIRPGHHDL